MEKLIENLEAVGLRVLVIDEDTDFNSLPSCGSPPKAGTAMTRAEIEAIVDRDLRYGDRRSAEYRAGAIDMVCRRALGSELSICHAAGSAQWDAYMAGVDRGWMIWKSMLEAEQSTCSTAEAL